MTELEKYTLDFITETRVNLPQISVIGNGDENGNYIGYRANDDNTYSLMLKDRRTDFDLNIYASDGMNSDVLANFKEYDPRTRQWYMPVKENQVIQWSEVYVNYDEKMELTISSLLPIFLTMKTRFGEWQALM